MSPPGETGTASTASRLEQFVRAFEEAWARGERPQLVNFLSSVRKEERCRALVELALAELELRLKAGEPARAEDYLACFGELAADPAAAVSLIAAEYRLRRRREPALQAAEMIARFPLHAEALQQRLAEIDQDSEHGAILSTFRDDPPLPLHAAPPDHIGAYEILAELVRGSMGVVYRAYDPRRGVTVALKVMQRSDPEALYRFKHEFRALADMTHPNLVGLYDLAVEGNRWFFTMEYVEGVNFLAYVGLRTAESAPPEDPPARSLQLDRLRRGFGPTGRRCVRPP